MTDINKLQSKENSLFKSALVIINYYFFLVTVKKKYVRLININKFIFYIKQRFYEIKQYKKGLKATEQILRKNPEHGGTK